MNTKELIRAEIIKLQESTLDENRNFRSERDEGAFDALSKLEAFLDGIKKTESQDIVNAFNAGLECQKKSFWHNAAEEQPPRGRNVFIFSKEGGVAEGEYKNDGTWFQYRWNAKDVKVLKWAYPEDFMPYRKEN